MKELSIEEKAKLYDKAIKIAKSKIKNNKDHVLYEDDIIEIFPELKESDERIRKAIITTIHLYYGEPLEDKAKEMIAWLKKQGEYNPTWNKEDETGLADAMWAIKQARTIAKNENDMGNLWYAERWLKSFKERVQQKQKKL